MKTARPWPRFPSHLMLAAAAMLAAFVLMPPAAPAPGRCAGFLALFAAAFAVYAFAVRAVLRGPGPARAGAPLDGDGAAVPCGERPTAALSYGAAAVFIPACLFRIALLPAAPVLSGDLYRYLWDGRVLASGGNPYAAAPADPGRAALRRTFGHPLEHAATGTVYPPGAQALFAVAAALPPGVTALKSLVVLADLLAIAVLRRILARRGLPPARVLIYAWNPLAVVETAWSGHIEPAGIVCVLFAAAAIIQERDRRATLALAAGGLVKLFPLVLILPLLRFIRIRSLVLAGALFAAAWWPFRAAGAGLTAGLREYASRWLGNESLFGVVHAGLVALDPTSFLKASIAFVRTTVPGTAVLDRLYPYVYPLDLAKAICAVAVLGCAAAIVRRRVEPLRACFLFTACVLLLSPTAHPWYFLWLLPWLCLFPSRAFILLSGLVVLSYLNLGAAGRAFEPHPWTRLAIYVPFFALLAADALGPFCRRMARGTPPGAARSAPAATVAISRTPS